MKKIAMANASGSAGKTTSVVTLATLGVQEGKRVLIVDCDRQGNASTWLNSKGIKPSTGDVLTGQSDITKAIRPVKIGKDAQTDLPGLFILPSGHDMTRAIFELERMPRRDERLAQALAAVEDIFDEVWLDCHGDLNLATMNALIAADTVITAVKPAEKETEGWGELVDIVKAVAQANKNNLRVEALIPCDVFKSAQGKAYGDGLNEVLEEHGDIVTEPVPHAVTQVEAYRNREPLPIWVPNDPVSKAYRKVRTQLAERGILA